MMERMEFATSYACVIKLFPLRVLLKRMKYVVPLKETGYYRNYNLSAIVFG